MKLIYFEKMTTEAGKQLNLVKPVKSKITHHMLAACHAKKQKQKQKTHGRAKCKKKKNVCFLNALLSQQTNANK